MSNKTTPILQAQNISKTYQDGKILNTEVLKKINLEVYPGETLAIIGSSGSGKSTLLHLLGGLDQPTSGKILLNGQNFSDLNPNKRAELRNQYLGFVYQFHHLLPELSALENIALPLFLNPKKIPKSEIIDQAQNLLDQVKLSHRAHHRPSELSGGERQRVAIARALINQPHCLLADEPTGNLDHQNARDIFDLLLSLNQTQGTALILVTHDLNLANQLSRKISLF